MLKAVIESAYHLKLEVAGVEGHYAEMIEQADTALRRQQLTNDRSFLVRYLDPRTQRSLKKPASNQSESPVNLCPRNQLADHDK